jgi:predicted permease
LRLLHADLGYDPRNAMVLPIPIHQNTHGTWQDRSEYFEQIRARLANMPEVVDSGISTNLSPPPMAGQDTVIEIMSRVSAEKPQARVNLASPEYFSVLKIPLEQGRIFDHTETMHAAPLALINQAMARQQFPNGDAIGQQIRIPALKDEPPYSLASTGSTGWLQIVGVVGDSRNDGLRNPVKPAVYVPYTLRMPMYGLILLRTRVPPLSILHDVRAQLVQVDREQQTTHVRDLRGWIERQDEFAQQKLVASLFGTFSVLALALAIVGLYSVVSYGVATRTREFGIRMALGAKAADVFRNVVASTSGNVGAGLLAGLILSFAFDKFATKWVSESSRDPLLLAGVIVLLIAAALLAAIIPARRAARVDPMDALRYQ